MNVICKEAAADFDVALIHGLGQDRKQAEGELLNSGVCLPLPQRAIWAENINHTDSLFLLIRKPSGAAFGGLGVEQIYPRSMPGHSILQVRMFGGNLPSDCRKVTLEALRSVASTMKRVLRLKVNVFSRTDHEEIAQIMRDLGYCELQERSRYRHTLAIDLRPTEEEIFAAIGKGTRRKIRDAYRMSGRSIPITDPIYAERIEELQQESLSRTGGTIARLDWKGVIRMSRDHPEISRVLGAFVGDDPSPDRMYAFGWVCYHGHHVEHHSMGTSRPDGMKVPVGHMLVWDLVCWAKTTGAEWFDMGGITLGNPGEEALAGISNFKRLFSDNVVEVGSEWILEPRAIRAHIADAISRSLRGLHQVQQQTPKDAEQPHSVEN